MRSSPRRAQAPPPGPAAAPQAQPSQLPPATDDGGEKGWWAAYTGYWDNKLEELSNKPLWGNTTQLPEGLLKLSYQYVHAQADSYYDRDGNRVPLVPRWSSPISPTMAMW